jgi:hypothetical protein
MLNLKSYGKRGKSNPHSYLIIGCGHFGSRAAEKLFQKDPHSKIIVVDQSKKALLKVSHLSIESTICEGTLYLKQFLSEGRKADYIIPAVPFHLVFEFIHSQLKPLGGKRRKVPPLSGLSNPMIGKTGDLYTSLANFLCSEDCPEPSQYCTITKKRRPKPLYQILNNLEGPFESKVIRSLQLAPGVGGFKPEALLGLLEDIKRKKNSGRSILVSTASLCHGVTSALSF